MTTMTRLRAASSEIVAQARGPSKERSFVSHLAGRLIQITLALYLLPALLIVLAVGGAGILSLMLSQPFTSRRSI
jgi:hypothetical protein